MDDGGLPRDQRAAAVRHGQRAQPGASHQSTQVAPEVAIGGRHTGTGAAAVGPHHLLDGHIQQRAGHRHRFGEDDRVPPDSLPPLEVATGVAARDLVEATRPGRLFLPVHGVLPPTAHHRPGESEHLGRFHARPAGPPLHRGPSLPRRRDLRELAQIEVLQGLVGVRVQQPPVVPLAHPFPALGVTHHTYRLPGAPGRARTAAERHRPYDSAGNTPEGLWGSCRVLLGVSSPATRVSQAASTTSLARPSPMLQRTA